MTYVTMGRGREADRAREKWRLNQGVPFHAEPQPGKRTLTEALPVFYGEPAAGPIGTSAQPPVQAKLAGAASNDGSPRPSLATLFGGAAGAGRPMASAVQAKMESSFGADFSDVRIHEGGEAAAVGARAFARGNHVHFAPGQYDPGSTSGQALLGHELAHVVQQRAGVVEGSQGKGLAVNADPGLEAEADRAGEQAARGEPAQVSGAQRGSRANASSDETIQGDFLDLLTNPVFLGILSAVVVIGVGVLWVRYQQQRQLEAAKAKREQEAREAEDQRQREEREAITQARDGAVKLRQAAEQAARIAGQAAQESKRVAEAASRADTAANGARKAEEAARGAQDATTALAGMKETESRAIEAIAAATEAVSGAAQAYLVNAAKSETQADAHRKDATRAADDTNEAAKAAAEAAREAESIARTATALIQKGDVSQATIALNQAIDRAKVAGQRAAAAKRNASGANEQASKADTAAQDATTAAKQLAKSPAAKDLGGAESSFDKVAPGSVVEARKLVEKARKTADQHRAHATEDAKHAKQAAQDAAKASAAAERAASEAAAAAFTIVDSVIDTQGTVIRKAVKEIAVVAERANDADGLKEARATAKAQRQVLEQVQSEARKAKQARELDGLSKLLDDAVAAAARATGAVTAARAAVTRVEAKKAVESAETLTKTLTARVRKVDEANDRTKRALDDARQALAKANEAMQRAETLQHGAREAAARVTADDEDIVKAAKLAMDQFREIDELLDQARRSFESAERVARQADQDARETLPKARARDEVSAIRDKRQIVTEAEHGSGGLASEVERAKGSELAASEAEQALARGASTAEERRNDAVSAQKDAVVGNDRANAHQDANTKALQDKAAELAARGHEALVPVQEASDELAQKTQLIEHNLGAAKPKLDEAKKRATASGSNTSKGDEAMKQAEASFADLKQHQRDAAAACSELAERLKELASMTDLVAAAELLGEVRKKAAETQAQILLASRPYDEASRSLIEVNDDVQAHDTSNRRGLTKVAKADPPWAASQRLCREYEAVWTRLQATNRVLDVPNLTAKQAVPNDANKYYSDKMELEYMASALERQADTHAQVGSMTFAQLKTALLAAGLNNHAALFTQKQNADDAQLFGLDVTALRYEADGVLWSPDRVEVVQHKRTTEARPLEQVHHNNRSYKMFEDQLRGAANQLGGWTAEGGRMATDARTRKPKQPEYPPPGVNRTRTINIELAQAERPTDFAEYEASMQTVMRENAGTGKAPRHAFVEQIRITWKTGDAVVFTHRNNGVYTH